jgi:hypothetical protein
MEKHGKILVEFPQYGKLEIEIGKVICDAFMLTVCMY